MFRGRGTAAGSTDTAGDGIIEGTEVKVGAAMAEGITAGEFMREPTDWNGNDICLGLEERPDFIWAKDDPGRETAITTAKIRFMRLF